MRGGGENRAFVVAQALALDMIVVTNNAREFERVVGLKTENWLR